MWLTRSAARVVTFLRADNPYPHGHIAAASLLRRTVDLTAPNGTGPGAGGSPRTH